MLSKNNFSPHRTTDTLKTQDESPNSRLNYIYHAQSSHQTLKEKDKVKLDQEVIRKKSKPKLNKEIGIATPVSKHEIPNIQ